MYKIERIREFTQTDFPEPVEPAIKRCGVFARSIKRGSPEMSFPKITGIAIFSKAGFFCSIISRKLTTARFLFGISIPTADFPGIGETMRTEVAASLSAILSCKERILFTFTPGAGRISNIVTTGPFRIPVTFTSILNSARVCARSQAFFFVSSSTIQYSPLSYFCKIPSTGIL